MQDSDANRFVESYEDHDPGGTMMVIKHLNTDAEFALPTRSYFSQTIAIEIPPSPLKNGCKRKRLPPLADNVASLRAEARRMQEILQEPALILYTPARCPLAESLPTKGTK